MATCKIKLKARAEIARETLACYFDKPPGFNHKAGQFGDFTLIDPPETDAEGNTRAFTFANAPHEDSLMVATRERDSAFKRILKTMALGTEISLDAPHGSFTLHSDANIPAVFITGGIGITPVRSIVLQATRDKLPHTITLFYSNKRPEDAAFLDDLNNAQRENPNLSLVCTMTNMADSACEWNGETGVITGAMIGKSVADLALPIYYLCGPRGMVAAMRELLEESGVKDDKVRTEEFSGY